MKESEKLGHYCGVVGIESEKVCNIPQKLFYPLFALQHRGQESSGIAYFNLTENKIYAYKDLGLVSDVLGRYLQKDISSTCGIGHVRYSTHGGSKVENAQPFHVTCNKGNIALAHNGNISNAKSIRKELQKAGAIFQTTSDSELLFHLISRSKKENIQDAIKEAIEKLEGAFSFVMMVGKVLIGIRDRNGYRPLYIGKKKGLTAIVSETCALDSLNIQEYREIEPGEAVTIHQGVETSYYLEDNSKKQNCIFEQIYFGRPDSDIYGESVYCARKKMGAMLAKIDREANDLDADLVIPVPESGNVAALGYAQESGLPFEFGLTRNFYSGRSFIMPTTEARELAVRTKLNPNRSILKDKKIVLVDDSLVRGTTSKILVRLLKEAGVKEVHLRLSSPELHFPCYYGIDIPTKKELISNSKSPKEIAEFIGADSVKFLDIEHLKKCVKKPEEKCYACFNGEHFYPTPSEKD